MILAPDWRAWLPALGGLPLLPCGAGKEGKAPIDPVEGCGLEGWESAGFSPDQIATMAPRVSSVGCRTGPPAGGLLAIDVDGPTAVDFCRSRGCDPYNAPTWRVLRDTAPDRLKVLFRLPPDLWEHLPGKRKRETLPADRQTGAKGEQIELFFGSGQVLVLGSHKPTGGHYYWPEGGTPAEIAEPSPEWWALALEVIADDRAEEPNPAQRQPLEIPAGSPGPLTVHGPQDDLTRARSAIQALDAGMSHDDWVQVGMAAHAINDGPEGFALWDSWSKTSGKYDPRAIESAWRSFSPGPISAATLFHLARQAGWRDAPPSDRTKGRDAASSRPQGGASIVPPPDRFQPLGATGARWGEVHLSHTRRMDRLDRCIASMSKRVRNSIRRRVRLIKAARDLGLSKDISRQDLAQRVLEEKDAAAGQRYQGFTAAERRAMVEPVVTWAIPGLVPAHDLTIIGGRAKVGKTRLAVYLAAAAAQGLPVLGFPAPEGPREVILITDDQADGDSASMMRMAGLWGAEGVIWSRHFRLTEPNLDALLADIEAHPGALVILDSLRSISRSLAFGENDPEIGSTLYDLKAAVIEAGATLVLVHHCNKGENLVGTEALSGHGSIAGAANTVLTLHYLGGKHGLQKEIPERRLVLEGRSGQPLDIVVTVDDGGREYRRLCTHQEFLARQQEGGREDEATSEQSAALEVLKGEPERFWTLRDIADRLSMPWDGSRGTTGRRLAKWMSRLSHLGLCDSERSGNEKTYSYPPRTHRGKWGKWGNLSDTNGSEPLEQLGEVGEVGEPPSTTGFSAIQPSGALPHRDPVPPVPPVPPIGGNLQIDLPDWGSPGSPGSPTPGATPSAPEAPEIAPITAPRKSLLRSTERDREPLESTAPPSWFADLVELVRQKPGRLAYHYASDLDPGNTGRPTGAQVRDWLADATREAQA